MPAFEISFLFENYILSSNYHSLDRLKGAKSNFSLFFFLNKLCLEISKKNSKTSLTEACLMALYPFFLYTCTFLTMLSRLYRNSMYTILSIFWKTKVFSFQNWQNSMKDLKPLRKNYSPPSINIFFFLTILGHNLSWSLIYYVRKVFWQTLGSPALWNHRCKNYLKNIGNGRQINISCGNTQTEFLTIFSIVFF